MTELPVRWKGRDAGAIECLRATSDDEIIAANEEIGVSSLVLDGVIFDVSDDRPSRANSVRPGSPAPSGIK